MFASYGQDPAVTRYLSWRCHTDHLEAREAIQRFLTRWESETEFCWMIFDRRTEELIGSIAARPEERGFNLGFLLAQAWWGRGLMPEAIGAVTQWAFSNPFVSRVWAVCDLENRASARALEKSGFTKEGVLRDYSLHPNISAQPRDCYSYAMTRAAHA
jgi:ribosomal-protein-alanine N-acetyltransferase